MPVTNGSFDKIDNYSFKTDDYEKLYSTLKKAKDSSEVLSEQQSPEYYSRVYAFYDYLRNEQKRFMLSGAPTETLSDGLWQKLFEK